MHAPLQRIGHGPEDVLYAAFLGARLCAVDKYNIYTIDPAAPKIEWGVQYTIPGERGGLPREHPEWAPRRKFTGVFATSTDVFVEMRCEASPPSCAADRFVSVAGSYSVVCRVDAAGLVPVVPPSELGNYTDLRIEQDDFMVYNDWTIHEYDTRGCKLAEHQISTEVISVTRSSGEEYSVELPRDRPAEVPVTRFIEGCFVFRLHALDVTYNLKRRTAEMYMSRLLDESTELTVRHAPYGNAPLRLTGWAEGRKGKWIDVYTQLGRGSGAVLRRIAAPQHGVVRFMRERRPPPRVFDEPHSRIIAASRIVVGEKHFACSVDEGGVARYTLYRFTPPADFFRRVVGGKPGLPLAAGTVLRMADLQGLIYAFLFR